MKSRLTILNLFLLLCAQVPAIADIQGPSLASGAIIEISGGMPAEQEIRRYKRKHGSRPEPRSLRLEVRAVQSLDGCEYYLDDCGLEPVTLDGATTVTYFGYYVPPSGATRLTFNIDREVGGKTLTYCFCLRESNNESVCRGAGVPAEIIWDSCEDNVYRGRIRGVLFHPGSRDGVLSFQWKPITLTVPKPGERLPMTEISDVHALPQSSAEPTGEAQPVEQAASEGPEPPTVAPSTDRARASVGQRLRIAERNPADTEPITRFCVEKVFLLANGAMISHNEIMRLASKVVDNWSRSRA